MLTKGVGDGRSMAYKSYVCNMRGVSNMELSGLQKTLMIGDTVSYLDRDESLHFGEIRTVDEGTPQYPLVVEFDDKTTRHFTLDGRGRDGREIKLIHRKK